MVTDPPPKIGISEAVQIVSKAAKEQFGDFKDIYCKRAEAPIRAEPRPDGKVVVWIFYYRIPNNGHDLEAEKNGWFNVWGDGIIELYEDKTCKITTMPKIIK